MKTISLVAPKPWRRRMIKMDEAVKNKIHSLFRNAGDKL